MAWKKSPVQETTKLPSWLLVSFQPMLDCAAKSADCSFSVSQARDAMTKTTVLNIPWPVVTMAPVAVASWLGLRAHVIAPFIENHWHDSAGAEVLPLDSERRRGARQTTHDRRSRRPLVGRREVVMVDVLHVTNALRQSAAVEMQTPRIATPRRTWG
jgi:hypothetical protein